MMKQIFCFIAILSSIVTTQAQTTAATVVDECAMGLHNCDVNADCISGPGGFICSCSSGYSGNGTFCADVDECATGLHNCASNAFCTNVLGGFFCTCNNGYEGDGTICLDINECAENTNNCDSSYGRCFNSDGSFSCACSDGFTGDGVSCTDIDECEELLDPCGPNAVCTNFDGFFDCNCNPGFVIVGVSGCQIPCGNETCYNGGTCGMDDICICMPGFTGEYCNQAVACGNTTCINGACFNDTYCECLAGYTGEYCQNVITETTPPSVINSTANPSPNATGSPVNCTRTSCLNGGSCVNGAYCICFNGYSGEYCQNFITETTTASVINGTAKPSPNATGSPVDCDFEATVTSTPMYFSSPEFPAFYSNNLRCNASFQAPTGYRILFNISVFDLERNYDSVKVYENGMLQATWTGTLGPFIYVSRTNMVSAFLFTDASQVRQGFLATYQVTNATATPTPTTPSFNFTTFEPPTTPVNNITNVTQLVCPYASTQCNSRAAWLCEYIRWRVEFLGEWHRTFEQWRERYTTLSGSDFYWCDTLYISCVNPKAYGQAYDYYGCSIPYCVDGLYGSLPGDQFQRWISDQSRWRSLYGRWRAALNSVSSGSSCSP